MDAGIKCYCCIRIFFLFALLLIYGTQVPNAIAENGSDTIKIGFSSSAFVNIPKTDLKIAVGVLAKKVAAKTFNSVETRIYESSAEMENDLKVKKLDLLALTTDEFIQLKSRTHLEPAVIAVAGNSREMELLLLVRKDSNLNGVADLKGRIIALPAKDVQYGVIHRTWIETLVMKEGGGTLEKFFSSYKETSSAAQAIMPVFFRKAAACVVSKQAFEISAELNPQLSKELKPIAQIGRLAGGLMVFRKDVSDVTKQKTKRVLLDLEKDQEGRQLLMLFHLTRLHPFQPEDLRGTSALFAEHYRLIAKRR